MRRASDSSSGLFSELLNFYLFSNIHIALCAAAMVGVTDQFFRYHLRPELYVFVFCGTFFLYNLQRLPAAFANVEIERKFMRHRWNTQYRKMLLAISILAAVISAWAFFQLYLRTQLMALLPAALSIAYAFPSIYWRGKWIKLREIPGTKILFVALVWAMSCVWVPAAADNSYPAWTSPEVTLWFVSCGLMIFAITIPFDIRDLPYDGEKLQTIPAIFGVSKSKMLGIVLMIFSAAGVFLMAEWSAIVTLHQAFVYAAWSLITCIVIGFSRVSNHEYYYSLLIDGLMIILWAMLLLL
jgi:hypothetical protein